MAVRTAADPAPRSSTSRRWPAPSPPSTTARWAPPFPMPSTSRTRWWWRRRETSAARVAPGAEHRLPARGHRQSRLVRRLRAGCRLGERRRRPVAVQPQRSVGRRGRTGRGVVSSIGPARPCRQHAGAHRIGPHLGHQLCGTRRQRAGGTGAVPLPANVRAPGHDTDREHRT